MTLRDFSRCARAAFGRLALICLLVASWLGSAARADEASGTWTGQLEGRLNYFYETSTRVVIPAAKVELEAPNGIRMNVNYLVDVISSASIAQTGGGSDAVFHELRHAVGGGVGKRFELGDNELDLSAFVTFSTESDYTSWLYGISGSFAWNDKDSALRFGLTRVNDTVYNNTDPTFKEPLDGLTASLGFAQVLSPELILGFGYELVTLNGFLGNPYRKVLIGPLPHAEAPPDNRLRHNLESQLSWFLPRSQTTLQAYARAYLDSWQVAAVSPELRVYQQLSRSWVMRLRYRFYDQTRADFALKPGETRYMVGYTGATTSDPKLSAFLSNQIGVRFEVALGVLSGTFVDFARTAVLDLSFDYQWNTSTFGNNVIATAGGRLPF
jgi:hypothetical protein